MNRFALLSDIHGNLPALQAVADDLASRDVRYVFNLGDSLSGPLLARETADFLIARGWPTLAGNHERNLLSPDPARLEASDAHALAELQAAHLAWLRGLPAILRPAPDVLLCHGTPSSDTTYALETIAQGRMALASPAELTQRLGSADQPGHLIACGHSHQPRALLGPGGACLVNPGSVGLPAYRDDDHAPHRVETGAPHARYAVAERGRCGWSVSLLAVAYDFEPMARLAERHGRADWAQALRTGRVSG